jgi:hypothetical protein
MNSSKWLSYLPERWQKKLTLYLKDEFGENRSKLLGSDFRHNVTISFGDGSFAFFRYSFYLIDQDAKEVAVFTEHCGYHIFPLGETQLELMDSQWTDIG